ncbi:MAG: 3-deoxy-7-phosphoheptulonate synthase, partial [Bacteroidia bacterium]|nr:3-deoxy-7-phosphoheptulonate synthase [Bacteroidia bacterium]
MSDLKLVGKQHYTHKSVIKVGNELVGAKELCLIAGPCAVESEEQLNEIAKGVSDLGVKFMRGGAYKPRTSPYAFQGLQKEGLKLLKKASDKYGVKIVTEVLDTT